MSILMTPAKACRHVTAVLAGSINDAGEVATNCGRLRLASDGVGRVGLFAGLRDGKWTATGDAAADSDVVKIPTRHWRFLTLDIDRSSAASPRLPRTACCADGSGGGFRAASRFPGKSAGPSGGLMHAGRLSATLG